MVERERWFYVYDFKRDRFPLEFIAPDEFAARAEFSDWYNRMVRPDRWEGRKLGRYWLFEELRDDVGELVKPRRVMPDEDVRLCPLWFRCCDPPFDAESEAARDAEFARLDAADVARIFARGNRFAEFFNGKPLAA